MGQCYAKNVHVSGEDDDVSGGQYPQSPLPSSAQNGGATPRPTTNMWPSPYPHDVPGASPMAYGASATPSPARSTPRRIFRRPPSPAKHIKAALAKRFGGGGGEKIEESPR